MTDKVLQAFGTRMGELRKGRGLTQEAFAREAGLDRAWLGRLERGTQNPSLVTLSRIARAFRIDLGDLVKGLPLTGRDGGDGSAGGAAD